MVPKDAEEANLGMIVVRKPEVGLRTEIIGSYELPRFFYCKVRGR